MPLAHAPALSRQPNLHITHLPASLLQRACACEGNPDQDEEQGGVLRRAAFGPQPAAGVPASVRRALLSPGQPLDDSARALMEPRFGHDFGRVRIHRDAQSAESARAVNALAYTVGNDIVFGSGQFAPATPSGRRILAHELTHVVQQSDAGPAERPLTVGEPDDASEQEADRASRSIFAGDTIHPMQSPGAAHVQRDLLGRGDDPIHAPLIDSYRKEKGLPPGGKDEFGNPVGPSDAQIKYGGLLTGKSEKSDKPSTPAAATEDPGTATADKTLATYAVDKQGKVHGMNIDTITKSVVQALKASDRAYIVVFGSYPKGDTDFDPTQPGDTVRNALVQWIGKTSVPNIESRITSDYGNSGPLPPANGGSVAVEVRYKPIVLSNPMGPLPSVEKSAAGSKGAKESKGLETEASVVIDPKSGTVQTQVELSWEPESGPAKELKLTVHVGAQGFSQLEADLAVLKKEIQGKFAGGTISKITITGGFNFSADFDRDARQRLVTQFSAAVKGALEVELAVPNVSKKPTIEISAGVDTQGKPSWGINFTPFKW
jgi:hypothetical protein